MQYNHAVQPCARYCHPFPCRYNVDQYLLQSVLSGLSDLQVEFPFKLSPAGGGVPACMYLWLALAILARSSCLVILLQASNMGGTQQDAWRWVPGCNVWLHCEKHAAAARATRHTWQIPVAGNDELAGKT